MANITLTGILLDSLGEVDVGAIVTFTHETTTGQTIATTKSDLIVAPNGAYSITLEYGEIRIDYTTRYTERFVGTVIVNGDTTATNLPELLNAAVPVTPAVILQMQGILSDAEAAADTSEAFADQMTTLDLIGSAAVFATDTNITTKGYLTSGDGGAGSWKQNGVTGQTVSQSPAQLGNALLNDASGNQWALVLLGGVSLESLGGLGNDTFDNSLVRDAALSALQVSGSGRGGKLLIQNGIYLMGGFELPSLVLIEGASKGSSVIKLIAGSNENLLTVPTTSDQCGWSKITIDGNRAENTIGDGVFVEAGVNNDGNSFSPFTDKTNGSPYSYKHLVATDFAVGNCAGKGIHTSPSNYQIFMDNFSSAHNGSDGIRINSSDGIYSNFYTEKNDICGIWAGGAANKFANFKSIWSGRVDNTFGSFRDQGSYNQYVNGEAQDNYCDGILILGNGGTFINCSGNTNGYLAVGNEISSGVNYDIRIGSTAVDCHFVGESHTYKTTVGTDGKWVTQAPYFFNSYSAAQFTTFSVDFDEAHYNDLPNVILSKFGGASIGQTKAITSNKSTVSYDTDLVSPDGVGDQTVRYFRDSGPTTGLTRIVAYASGTSVETSEIRDTGYTNLSKNDAGPVIVGGPTTGGRWDTSLFRLGETRIFMGSDDKLRLKVGSDPVSGTDGIIIGTQT